MRAEVPDCLDGLKVIQFARLPTKMLPKGYTPPAIGGGLEAIDLIVIATGEGLNGQLFWVRCLNERLETVTGDVYYSLESAKRFPVDEYGIAHPDWQSL